MNVAAKVCDGDVHTQLLLEELGEAMDKMVGAFIACVDQRIMHIQSLNARSRGIERCNMGIACPNRISRGSNVRDELTGMCAVEVPNGS